MPNLFSAFHSEVFRPLVTLLLPGALAVSSWFVGLLFAFKPLRELVARNHTESAFVLLLAMLLFGMMIEDLGSHVESWFDVLAKRRNSNHLANWYSYLRTAYKADPIGRRYIRSVVLRLKFEFGVSIGALAASAGILWLMWLGMPCRVLIPFLCIGLVAFGFELYEAYSTHALLAEVRGEMLQPICIVG